MQKAMSAMLELSMATMYKDAMSRAMEADFEKGVREYYERSIQMGIAWNAMKDACDEAQRLRDHYQQEGLP